MMRSPFTLLTFAIALGGLALAASVASALEDVASETSAKAPGPIPQAAALEAAGIEAPDPDDDAASAPSQRGSRARLSRQASAVLGGPTPVTVIVQEGDTPTGGGGNAVTSLNAPFSNGDGEVGFTGNVDNGGSNDAFVWFDTSIAWLNSSAVGVTLSGAEGTMGVGNNGEFIYSPSVDGSDSVWTHNGLLLSEDTQAPGFPAGTNSTFHSRPTMLPGGQSYWISGFNETGGTGTEGRILYTSSDSTPGTIAVVLRSDDMIGGLAIDRPSGLDFDYHLSDDASHHIQVLLMDTGSTTDDGHVYVDGAFVARETDPSGDGDNWDNFDTLSINNAGNYLFSGDTDGATSSDEFIAYNGAIALREGDTVGGVTLTSAASVRAVSLNNLQQALHLWGVSGGTEILFFASDASDLSGTSTPLLSTGDMVDVDGNGTADATVTDFNASSGIGPGLSLAEDGRILVEVDLDFGAGDVEAIISLGPPADLVINEVDYDQSGTDEEEFIEIYNPSSSPINLDPYSLELVNGTGGGAAVYATIDLPDVSLAAGDYYVVCGDAAMVPGCDLDTTPDTNLIQNGGPDAVALTLMGSIVDTLSYEGDTGAPYTEGSGTGLTDAPGNDFFSISRIADGVDTDQNNVDFAGRCNSPGLPNMTTTSGCVLVPVELLSFSID
ncbi:MAG: lamin tail domain-containing protein [Deltaproteobacteria bacterium]|nr:lamin tail domain-containing protein [Deltaproteobacteria bacterium]